MKTVSWKSRAATATVCFATALGAVQLPAHALDAAAAAPQTGNSTSLVLNGTGVRRGTTTYLYTANLYLERQTANPAEVLQNKGTKHFRMVMLHDASAAQMADLLTEGLVANASEDDLITMVSEIFDVGLLLSEQGKLSAGDSFEIDSHPATGTTLTIRSSTHRTPITQTFANPRMFKVMMGIWLGEHAADVGLKSALLGQAI
jgi:hypothetical protein